jgi:hypothetical protein
MFNKEEGTKLVKECKPTGTKPEACPKCGSKKIDACPGGSSVKAKPGIWWSCQDCHNEW